MYIVYVYVCKTCTCLFQVGSLVATATDVLIKALQIKLAYINDVLERLSLLISDNPRQAPPTELSFSHYEEWLESNQQLFEFNSQLYELERVKFELKQKQERVKQTKESESDAETVVGKFHSTLTITGPKSHDSFPEF